MPEAQRITVCVVALTQSDYEHIEPNLRAKLGDPPFLAFPGLGTPYAKTPDDWRPFGDNNTITQLMKKANLAPSSMSTQLFEDATTDDTLEITDLYIIDPLVLKHSTKGKTLRDKVQVQIRAAKKAFCIILPSNIPSEVRTELAHVCKDDLGALFKRLMEFDLWEWEIESPIRLEKFLRRSAGKFSEKADRTKMRVYERIVAELFGTQSVDLVSSPRLAS